MFAARVGEAMGRLKASCVDEMARELRELLFEEKRFANQLIAGMPV